MQFEAAKFRADGFSNLIAPSGFAGRDKCRGAISYAYAYVKWYARFSTSDCGSHTAPEATDG
jgi:hypothetical protein